jgi:hypothetical protein
MSRAKKSDLLNSRKGEQPGKGREGKEAEIYDYVVCVIKQVGGGKKMKNALSQGKRWRSHT